MLEYLLFKLGLNLSRILSFDTIYKLSDIGYFFLYKVFKYRVDVVRNNLKLAFPQYSQEELTKLEQDYYHHLSDLFFETLKFYTLDSEELKKRLIVENPEILNQYYYAGKNIILAGAHIGNWELGPLTAPFWFKHQFVVLYKPLKNKKIDKTIKRLRTHFGTRLISIDITARGFTQGTKPFCIVMLADQNPGNVEKAFWVKFFNQPTATLHGLEIYSRRYNMPIFFFAMKKIKRGYYTARIEPLVYNPQELPKGYITQLYMQKVEQAIRKEPYLWLWSHRRWKHKFDPQKYQLVQTAQSQNIKVESQAK